jgi:hypothetical protein
MRLSELVRKLKDAQPHRADCGRALRLPADVRAAAQLTSLKFGFRGRAPAPLQ